MRRMKDTYVAIAAAAALTLALGGACLVRTRVGRMWCGYARLLARRVFRGRLTHGPKNTAFKSSDCDEHSEDAYSDEEAMPPVVIEESHPHRD